MQHREANRSTTKSAKLTMRGTASPAPFPEENSSFSLHYEDMRALMKKKQAEYQQSLLIPEAQRVHNLLQQMKEKQIQSRRVTQTNKKQRIKREVNQYNLTTMKLFEKQWNQTFIKTINELEQLENMVENEHQKEKEKALLEIEEAKNGKHLEKIKFSTQVLSLEDQLRRLTKQQRYQQAFVVKNRLEKSRKKQMHQFISQSVDRSRKSLDKLKKQQQKQRQLFGQRLSQVYIKQKIQYETEYHQLLKNIRTYEVDPKKISTKIKKIQKEKQQSQFDKSKSHPQSDIGVPTVKKEEKKIDEILNKQKIKTPYQISN